MYTAIQLSMHGHMHTRHTPTPTHTIPKPTITTHWLLLLEEATLENLKN